MSSALNLKAVKLFGPEISKVLNSGIEISAEMLEAATTLKSDGMEFSDALEVLQQLFPKETGASEGTMYLHGNNNVVVLGNISGGTINFASSSSSSRGRSRGTTSNSNSNSKANNGDWKFEGDRVFLNSPWAKAADCRLLDIEGAVIINTNDNGKKVKVGYYSKTQKDIKGFTEFHNTESKPTLKYGKGPEGYYYVKNSILKALSFLEKKEEINKSKTGNDETLAEAF